MFEKGLLRMSGQENNGNWEKLQGRLKGVHVEEYPFQLRLSYGALRWP